MAIVANACDKAAIGPNCMMIRPPLLGAIAVVA
jgi:hypothetical protein